MSAIRKKVISIASVAASGHNERTFERGGVGSVTGYGSLSVDRTNHLSVHGLNCVPPEDLGAPGGGEHEPNSEEGLEQEVEGCVKQNVRRPSCDDIATALTHVVQDDSQTS